MAVSLTLFQRRPLLGPQADESSAARIKTPPGLKLAGIVYLLLPVANLLYSLAALSANWRSLFAAYSLLALVLFLTAPVVAFCLLRVRRWGYFAFLIHAGVLMGYSLALFLAAPTVARSGEIVRSAAALLLLGYFLQRDISAPYLNAGWRGFRRRPRQLIQTGLLIGDQRATTRDLSVLGCYVNLPANAAEQYAIAQKQRVELQLHHGLTLNISAEVARIDPDGLGLRFYTSAATRRAIRQFLKLVFPKRYVISLQCAVEVDGRKQPANMLNVSRDGAYLAMAAPPAPETELAVVLSADQNSAALRGQVMWSNPQGLFQKPPGFGIRFIAPGTVDKHVIRKLIKQGERSR
ncbi:MAG: PilZ domain-containing protein [Leptospirales bacterium]|nr:PilZ domain-containing protein [Leptospirales bacterium]